jgi:YVTN family beta-propeller protein
VVKSCPMPFLAQRRFCFALVAALALMFFAAPILAQNFTPIAKAAAVPDEAFENAAMAFSSAQSIDPDEGPAQLTFLWDFGDGATATNANPTHVYTNAAAYRVSLTVSDGLDAATDFIVVHVLAPPTATQPSASSILALRPNGQELWVVNSDAASVSILSVTMNGLSKQAEISVGALPRTLAFSPDGSRVYVTVQERNELWVINANLRAVLQRIAVGHQPYGVAVSPSDGTILVSNQGDDSVSVIRPDGIVARIISVPSSPRSIAVTADGNFAFVSHFITRGAEGKLTRIDLRSNTAPVVVSLVEDAGPDTTSSGRGVPNILSALAVHPAGRSVWFGGLKANTGRGVFVNGEEPTPENTLRGFFGKVDVANASEKVLRRIDANDTDSVSAIAFSPNGRFAYVAHQGAGTLSTYDLSAASLIQPGDGNTVTFNSRVDVGHAPQGIVVSAGGTRAYVANFLSRNVQVLNLTNPSALTIISTVNVTAETLPPRIANGKRLFYRSKEPVHSRANYIACVSCHVDGGGSDGRTWDLTHKGEGLRNTTDLRSRGGLNHGPVHWSANFDEIQDFENDIVNAFGGTGLAQDGQPPNPPLGAPNAGRSVDLDDLAAYVSFLTNAPPSPYRKQDGTLSDAALRGKVLFNNPALQCASCHVPPRFTDSVLTNAADYVFHNVGTLTPASGQRLGGPLPGIDTPSLIGAWNSAPYLHDGSGATLLDVLTTRNTNDQHAVTSTLTANQLSDLVVYLQSIDGSTNDVPEDLDNDGISDSWERRFGLDPQNAADAALDTDNDGATNLAEFFAGTDPLEPNSRLRIHDIVRANNLVTLRFSTVPQKSYVAEYVASLTSTNWLPLATIPGEGAEKSITDTNAVALQRFYRIRFQ